MDLDIKRVLAARPESVRDVGLAPLISPWGETVRPDDVLGEHPRPELARAAYTMLNGWWEYAFVGSRDAAGSWETASAPATFDGRILVPFSPETCLSHVGRQLGPEELLWYRRTFEAPSLAPGERCVLHLDGVDWACACSVNGVRVGTHVGAYLPFSFDITDALTCKGRNELTLCVYDPGETGTQLRGKQRLRRGNMWYTAQGGIWQPVWLEVVPHAHVVALDIDANADEGVLRLVASVSEPGSVLHVRMRDAAGQVTAETSVSVAGTAAKVVTHIEDAHLWEPNDPYLYRLEVSYGTDAVASYCGFRSVTVEEDAHGTPRICLNHRPLFLRGVLYQGYWPESLLTAPTDEALVADLGAVRAHGFNLVRLHAKAERSRFYYHAARLGLMVWQDIPSGGGIPGEWPAANVPTLWRRSWRALDDRLPRVQRLLGGDDPSYQREWCETCAGLVRRLKGSPSVCGWVLFNESWGQFDARAACRSVSDAVRGRAVVLATSGWYDQGVGNVCGVHNYFRGMRVYPDVAGRRSGRRRAFVVSEFGGLTWHVEGHSSVATTYGYADFASRDAWHHALAELLARMDSLEAEGLSGFVYTQLTDVEEEVNGLVTYDRRIDKTDEALEG